MQAIVSTWPEQRSAMLHRLVARRLLDDPSRLDIARANLAQWEKTASPHVMPRLLEWKRLLEADAGACTEILNDTSEKTQALRSCEPLAGVISEDERLSVIASSRRLLAPA